MKRREFNFGLLAAGVAPLAKMPVAATAAPTAATAVNFTPFMYAAGSQFARFHGSCSAELLATRLGISPEAASAINARMIKNGIITAPNALGISRSTDKYAPTPKPEAAGGEKTTERAQRRLNLLEEDVEDLALDAEDEVLSDDADLDDIDTSEIDTSEDAPEIAES